MAREDVGDLQTFVAVARERSFTKAAAKLGISQSALSHAVSRFEQRIGIRLLTRTTRSVAPTQAGEKLLRTAGPRFDEIEAELASLTELRSKPAGTIRITCGRHAAKTVLIPKLGTLLPEYPDLGVDLTIDQGLTDIVARRFDAGVRLGEQVARGMIAVPISPDMRMAAVASPAYFQKHRPPLTPQELSHHTCINLWMQTAGTLYAWEFEKRKRAVRVRVEGQLTVSSTEEAVIGALAGLGIALVLEDLALDHLKSGRLVRVLEDWTPPFPGYHLYYTTRRQASAAFSLVVDALRHRR
ncbi:MAG TPA: LysR family transcriptional regulator [Kofleriaceae bacterium]|jgi:DNA-binding transcriptional LysR family regulator